MSEATVDSDEELIYCALASCYAEFEPENGFKYNEELYCTEEHRQQQEEEDGPQEPDEGDITTEDYETFYQYGKLYFEVPFKRKSTFRYGQQMTTNTDERQDWRKALKAKMKEDQFWPNVWSISDHGNCELLNLSKKD